MEFSSQEKFWLDVTSSLQIRILFCQGRLDTSFLSVNELGEKSRMTIILGEQAIITLLLAYSFRKTFIIGQKIKHVHVTYSFHELLIFF